MEKDTLTHHSSCNPHFTLLGVTWVPLVKERN